MNVGIFSKFHMSGGSEFRCVELANGIVSYTTHKATIFSDVKEFPKELRARLLQEVPVIDDAMQSPDAFTKMDTIICINSDSKEFTTLEFWDKHKVDLKKIKQMIFLFNFIVSPAKELYKIADLGVDVRILTTNKRFFDEISTKDKHDKIRTLPRMILESPICGASVDQVKTSSSVIRIGKHSKGLGNKWCEDHRPLILSINKDYENKVHWDFMGASKEVTEQLQGIPNVTLRKEFSKPIREYLDDIDIFLFMIDWGRQEPWARVVGEAMASSCPILAPNVDGGIQMQVVHGNNGYLCETVDDYYKWIVYLINNPKLIKQMGQNSLLYSKFFETEWVIKRLFKFIGD